MIVSLGRVVLFKGVLSNASMVHPAIVTRVWGIVGDGKQMVNLTVFQDASSPMFAGSVHLYDSEAEGDASGEATFCFWPPKVG